MFTPSSIVLKYNDFVTVLKEYFLDRNKPRVLICNQSYRKGLFMPGKTPCTREKDLSPDKKAIIPMSSHLSVHDSMKVHYVSGMVRV